MSRFVISTSNLHRRTPSEIRLSHRELRRAEPCSRSVFGGRAPSRACRSRPPCRASACRAGSAAARRTSESPPQYRRSAEARLPHSRRSPRKGCNRTLPQRSVVALRAERHPALAAGPSCQACPTQPVLGVRYQDSLLLLPLLTQQGQEGLWVWRAPIAAGSYYGAEEFLEPKYVAMGGIGT